MLITEKSVKINAKGQRTSIPTKLMAKLILKVLDRLETFLTKTTGITEVTAERIA
jgi:hypothetical protein